LNATATTTAPGNTYPRYAHSCDVLIIGGGSVGLRSAIEDHDAGANVLIIAGVEKEILIQYLQGEVSTQHLALWNQKTTG
jgi:thioredoxin reductase